MSLPTKRPSWQTAGAGVRRLASAAGAVGADCRDRLRRGFATRIGPRGNFPDRDEAGLALVGQHRRFDRLVDAKGLVGVAIPTIANTIAIAVATRAHIPAPRDRYSADQS